MVFLHICGACRDGLHSCCDGHRPAPKGYFGGSMCTCRCHKEPMADEPEKARQRWGNLLNQPAAPLTLGEIKTLVEKAAEWAESPEGQAALQDAMRKVKETIEMLEKERRMTPEDLAMPITLTAEDTKVPADA